MTEETPQTPKVPPMIISAEWDWNNLTDEQAEMFAELIAGLAKNNKARATQAANRMEKRGVKFGTLKD